MPEICEPFVTADIAYIAERQLHFRIFGSYLFGDLEFLDIFCVLDEALDYCYPLSGCFEVSVLRAVILFVFSFFFVCVGMREVFLSVWNLVRFLPVHLALDGPTDL